MIGGNITSIPNLWVCINWKYWLLPLKMHLVYSLILVRRICAKICDNRGFLRTSMKLGRVIEHDLRNDLRSGGTSDLTFGDL